MHIDKRRRGQKTRLVVLCLAALPPSALSAQAVPDAVPTTPPPIRDFSLPPSGNVATPAPAPAPVPPSVTQTTPAPSPAPTPPPDAAPAVNEAQPAAPAPAARRPRATPRISPRARAPAAVQPGTPAASPGDEPTALAPVETEAPVAAPPVLETRQAAPPVREERPAEAQSLPNWLYWLVPAAAALLLLGWLLKRRRRAEALIVDDRLDEALIDDELQAAPEPDIVPETEIAEEPVLAEAQHSVVPLAATADAARPDLEIIFKPAAASATDAQAAVEFTLTVVNNGDTPARAVRMEARMFAMGSGHDAALAEFLREPLEQPIAVAAVIEPGVQAVLRNQVTLPRERVQPIQVQNRSLFVPLVAFNILYEFGEGEVGQSAMSFVVGRENKPPAAKMAPFRLDQGPRIYREVGHRVHVPSQAA